MGREPIIQAVVEEAAALAAVALRSVHDGCLGASHCLPMKSLSVASRRKPQLQFRLHPRVSIFMTCHTLIVEIQKWLTETERYDQPRCER
jgi:hypothetical protein